MGCTIHLQGKLSSPELATALIDEVSSIASILEWDFSVVDDEHLRGISLFPDPRCDPLHLLFDRQGVLRYPESSLDSDGQHVVAQTVTMRTQGAPDDVTIGVATLLRQLDKHYFSELEVETVEGDWSESDPDEVAERCERTDRKLSVSIAELESVEQLFCLIPAVDVEIAAARLFWREQDRAGTPEERGAPPDAEKLAAWSIEEWVAYFDHHDGHLYPALRHMSDCEETAEGCAEAIARGREDEERSTEESPALFLNGGTSPESGPPEYDGPGAARADALPESNFPDEPTSMGEPANTEDRPDCFADIVRACGSFVEAVTVMGEVSVRRQSEWSAVLEFVTCSTMASVTGIYMAWRYWAPQEKLPIALNARYALARRRYAQIQRLLEEAGHPLWAKLAGAAAKGFEQVAEVE
jgi:hypothetical protein